LDNAATAIAILRKTMPDLPETAFAEGMRAVRWPGRMEMLRAGILSDYGPKDSEIWIDGGHNPAGAASVATVLADLEERSPKPLFLIVGMLTTKDASGYLSAFRGLAKHVHAVPVHDSDSGYSAGELAKIAAEAGFAASASDSVKTALRQIKKRTGEPVRILICGSLYLIGEVLRENGTPPA
jgi:dihydrofolate synthase/folylpolyglutamate synthase